MRHHSTPEISAESVAAALELAEPALWTKMGADEKVYVEPQFELFRCYPPDTTLPKYFVKAWFPYSADTFFNVATDMTYRKTWDVSVKQAYVIDRSPKDCMLDVVYWCVKLPWPFTNRDYVYHRRVSFVDNTFVILSHAGLHKDAPEVNHTIRVEAFASRIVIRATGVNGCDVYIEYCDESNYSVPNTLVNWALQTGLSSYLNDLKMACANYAGYTRSLSDDAVQEIPSQVVRLRSERQNAFRRALVKARSYSADDPDFARFAPLPSRPRLSPTSRSARFPAAPTAPPDDHNTFFVDFQRTHTGLQLEHDVFSKQVVVLGCEPNSEAARSAAALPRGTLVVSLNAVPVEGLSTKEVLDRIRRAPRPLLVGFQLAHGAVVAAPTVERGDGSVKLHVHYNDDLHTCISPRLPKSNVGAVLHKAFQLSDTLVPVGWQVLEINGSSMAELNYNEIVHSLRCNTAPKLVVLGQEADRGRPKLSLTKKLSRAFSSKAIKTPKAAPAVEPAPITASAAELDARALEETLMDYGHVAVNLDNAQWVWTHIQFLINEERLFSAAPLIEKLEQFLAARLDTPACAAIHAQLQAKLPALELVKERAVQGLQALHEFNADADAGWRFAQTYFGVSTHWKPGNDATIWLKLDGICEGVDIFNALAVVRETDLFNLWAPFCNKSELLANLGRVELITYLSVAIPLMQRDAVVHAFGINATYEHRCVVLLGKSITEEQSPVNNLEFPPVKGWNADRMELRAFRALVEPYGRNRGRTCIVVNVDPKCPVPMSLLNFTIKKMAGVLLYLLMREAAKVEKHSDEPGTTNPHVLRIQNDPFYAWLRPRMNKWFEHLEANTLPTPLSVRPRLERGSSGSVYGTRIETKGELKAAPRRRSPSAVVQVARGALDRLYDFALWPYVLLAVLYGCVMTPATPLWAAHGLKAGLSCLFAWFGVAGSFSWQARCNEHVMAELRRLRWRIILLAVVFEVVTSLCAYAWTHRVVCLVGPVHVQRLCAERSPADIRAADHFWMLANSFLVASFTAGIQVVVKIHI
ncbi:transmembrane protein [Achlya hypogyna]|uniref:Phosphatidylcholine transfer protein n=1 Tax=Achlya hypogyna TaxID=1202772 RepID=A0A1V9ZJU3_ACHHY|nr:transmembrane protein [Achlya hypogyna]